MLPKTDAAKYAAAHDNTTLLPNGKIRFDQTGMEFPSTVASAVLNAYAGGNSFRRTVARRANEAYDFSVHEPYVVPHRERDERHFLYCKLTRATLPRDAEIVQKHVSAKRFRRRLAEAEEAKKQREELAEKRREKRERAKASRSSKTEKEETEEGEDPMDEDNDVLEGLISDDDDDDSVEKAKNENDSMEPDSPAENTEGSTKQAAQNGDDAMEEDEAQETNAFWTRGRKQVLLSEDAGDNVNHGWGKPPKKEKATRRSKKRDVSGLVEKTVQKSSDSPSEGVTDATVTGKRNRVKVEIPKKVRRARQRRKATKQT